MKTTQEILKELIAAAERDKVEAERMLRFFRQALDGEDVPMTEKKSNTVHKRKARKQKRYIRPVSKTVRGYLEKRLNSGRPFGVLITKECYAEVCKYAGEQIKRASVRIELQKALDNLVQSGILSRTRSKTTTRGRVPFEYRKA